MDRASSFQKVVRRLHGVDVICFDRAGYGDRVHEPPPDPRIAGDAAELVERLDGRRSVVIGHSYGGHVAIAAALARPDLVVAVGVFETPLGWMPWWPARTSGGTALAAAETESVANAAEVFMRSLLGDAVWELLPQRTRLARRSEGDAMVADLRAIRAAPPYELTDLARAGIPVVVGRGEHAAAHHRNGCDRLLELLPDAELFVAEGAGHGCHTSHPDLFAEFARQVLARAER